MGFVAWYLHVKIEWFALFWYKVLVPVSENPTCCMDNLTLCVQSHCHSCSLKVDKYCQIECLLLSDYDLNVQLRGSDELWL